jgi:hypothetical protein
LFAAVRSFATDPRDGGRQGKEPEQRKDDSRKIRGGCGHEGRKQHEADGEKR